MELIALFTVSKQTRKLFENGKILSLSEKLTLVSEKAPKLKDFLFLHSTFIFTCFGAINSNILCLSIDFVCWLAKNANHNIKTMEKQTF